MRTIIELGSDGPRAFMLVSGGQSGRVNSKNYCDQVMDFRLNRYHLVQFHKQFNANLFPTIIQFKPRKK
jgi:acyl-homoserine lactone acylase PvdQ